MAEQSNCAKDGEPGVSATVSEDNFTSQQLFSSQTTTTNITNFEFRNVGQVINIAGNCQTVNIPAPNVQMVQQVFVSNPPAGTFDGTRPSSSSGPVPGFPSPTGPTGFPSPTGPTGLHGTVSFHDSSTSQACTSTVPTFAPGTVSVAVCN